MIELPDYARVVRSLPNGDHPFRLLLPGVVESPAVRRIGSNGIEIEKLLESARVRIVPEEGYIWVDIDIPAIILTENYYRKGNDCDLYLDLLHELTHLRQLAGGHDLWDENYPYVDRPTEIEGYAVAIEEGLRLGMTEAQILQHLSNPWMSDRDVRTLRQNVCHFLASAANQI
jgi:hypothetical protein